MDILKKGTMTSFHGMLFPVRCSIYVELAISGTFWNDIIVCLCSYKLVNFHILLLQATLSVFRKSLPFTPVQQADVNPWNVLHDSYISVQPLKYTQILFLSNWNHRTTVNTYYRLLSLITCCALQKKIHPRFLWDGFIYPFADLVNALWPGDTIWRQRYESTLVQVMACRLTTPIHYLNQYRPMTSEVFCHLPVDARHLSLLWIWKFEITNASSRGQWVKHPPNSRNSRGVT